MLCNDENSAPSNALVAPLNDKKRPVSTGSRDSTISSASTTSLESIRSARATKVFGDLIGEENSLSYSPSPCVMGKKTLGNITNVTVTSPAGALPFGTIEFSPKKSSIKKSQTKKSTLKTKGGRVDSGKENDSSLQFNPQIGGGGAKVHAMKKKQQNKKFRSTVPSASRKVRAVNTQKAINKATESVNQTLNTTRVAKERHTREMTEQAARLREEWLCEKEDAKAFFVRAEREKRELLNLKRELGSQYAQAKVDHERFEIQKKLTEVNKEIQFKSDVFVQHQKTIKDNEDKRRRMSAAIKYEIHKERRAASERIKLESIEEQHERVELQCAASRDAQDYKKKCAEERRVSFAFRNAEGRRQRQEEAERKAEEQDKAHEQFEFKMAAKRDVDEYKKQCEKERRESLAFRNAEGRQQREEEAERQERDKFEEHERHELRMAGKRDVDEYKKECQKERRESFAFRNAEGRRQREEEAERKAIEQNEAHERFKLKMAAKRDEDEYRKECEKNRRESFALRGQETLRHRQVMEEIRSLAKEKEHEHYLLKWAAQDDVKEYLSEEAEKRRESLAFRCAEGKRHRDLEEQWRCDEIEKKHEEEIMKAGAQKDVEEYKKKCADRDRASFCYRGKELQLQKLELEKQREEASEIEQKRRDLETAARGDVEEYLEDCKKRRRLSLAFRAKERRRHEEWKKQVAEEERQKRSQHRRRMATDRRHVEFAQEKERAENALLAIRHAGRQFKMNPFAPLLE